MKNKKCQITTDTAIDPYRDMDWDDPKKYRDYEYDYD